MGKHYIYLMANKQNFVHVGTCKNPVKMIEFYNKMPSTSMTCERTSRLVCLADGTETECKKYFDQLNESTVTEKWAFIEMLNPGANELKIGDNILLK